MSAFSSDAFDVDAFDIDAFFFDSQTEKPKGGGDSKNLIDPLILQEDEEIFSIIINFIMNKR